MDNLKEVRENEEAARYLLTMYLFSLPLPYINMFYNSYFTILWKLFRFLSLLNYSTYSPSTIDFRMNYLMCVGKKMEGSRRVTIRTVCGRFV